MTLRQNVGGRIGKNGCKMATILFWDIDGTLLTTARAGIFALEDAASEVIGARVELGDLPTAGLTDSQIAVDILRRYGVEPEPTKVKRLLQLYGEKLPLSLHRRQGAVMQGVREILDLLHPRKDVLSLLLTGNIETGAWAKLAHYGLTDYFVGGAFSDGARDRVAIAREALAAAEIMVKGTAMSAGAQALSPDRLFVIGDTPHDIHCGKAINARVVAIASGCYDLAALEQHNPWWALPSLPEPAIFLEKIGLARD
jgi:phosphoglycolate phosphatase-like HAD superfamily hydrolase